MSGDFSSYSSNWAELAEKWSFIGKAGKFRENAEKAVAEANKAIDVVAQLGDVGSLSLDSFGILNNAERLEEKRVRLHAFCQNIHEEAVELVDQPFAVRTDRAAQAAFDLKLNNITVSKPGFMGITKEVSLAMLISLTMVDEDLRTDFAKRALLLDEDKPSQTLTAAMHLHRLLSMDRKDVLKLGKADKELLVRFFEAINPSQAKIMNDFLGSVIQRKGYEMYVLNIKLVLYTLPKNHKGVILQHLPNVKLPDYTRHTLRKEVYTVFRQIRLEHTERGGLQNLFPKIYDEENNTFFGGWQNWWSDDYPIRADGGCGPVAAANILAYMALNNPAIAEALGVDPEVLLTKSGFIDFMNLVYKTVTPLEKEEYATLFGILSSVIEKVEPVVNSYKDLPIDLPDDLSEEQDTFGFWPVQLFKKKVVDFANTNNLSLTPTMLSNTISTIKYDEGLTYIYNAIDKDCPIALLNLLNVTKMTRVDNGRISNTQTHWVTITSYENVKDDTILTVSSWGAEWLISYNDLYESWQSPYAIGSGMVYFEVK
ncbi:MAG: hypothetical protein LBC96_07890 [Lachnospiraceae bacterium]|jgi:hypothetical protein|nr:hypothetical protein [Lachnospiraceae bacterium]